MERRYRKTAGHLALWVVLLLCLGLVPWATLPSRAHAAVEDDAKTVRVGYYENEVFEEGAKEGAVKRGYAYEYYRKLSEYTGWKYEYVYGDYNDLYDLLLEGKVDLLAGLAYKEERANLIGYPELPMGNETYALLKHKTDDSVTTDPSTLAHKKVGVLDSAITGVLTQYLKKNNVDAEVVTYDSYDLLMTAFDEGAVDLAAVEGDVGYGREQMEHVLSFGASDYFLCVAKNRPDLLTELNEAQSQLVVDEPNYIISLSAKYYAHSVSSRSFSAAERTWLDTHDKIHIGYLKNYLPYSDTNEQGGVTGLLCDYAPKMVEDLGIERIKLQYTGYDSYDAMIADMNKGVIDAAFPVGGGLYYSEEGGMYQTNPVIVSPMELVYRGEPTDDMPQLIAVNQKNAMQYYYIKTYFPHVETMPYPSIDDCLAAVLSGEVDCTVLNGLRANNILRNSKYDQLSMQQLSHDDSRCFGVKIGNEGLLKLLNHGINVVGEDYALNQAYKYTSGLYTYSLSDLLEDWMPLMVVVVLGVATLVVFLVMRDSRRAKREMLDKEQARLALEEKNRELERSKSGLADSYEIIADAGYGTWYIVYGEGEGEQPRMRGNAKVQEILGYVDEPMTEREAYEYWLSRIADADLTTVMDSLNLMLKGETAEHTYRWHHPFNGTIYIRCGGTIKRDGRSERTLRGYMSDVTAIVRDEHRHKETLSQALLAAEHANRAKTTFLNNMSHDIRTPMNAIVGFTELAQDHVDNPEQVADYLDKIAVSSQHLLSLINDVLDMSRIESGSVTIEETQTHLPEVIHDLRNIIQVSVSAKQQDLFIDTRGVDHEDIVVDKLRLSQVLLNILSNAIKFTHVGGSIHLQVVETPCPQEGYASFSFSVSDNGIGMSAEFQKTIFDAFTREQTSTVSGIQGTGLGMAITKNIVDIMGGTISVSSVEGEGSTFVVELTCKIADDASGPEPMVELEGLRALVVDDDMNTCLSVCAMLRTLGMQSDWTGHGKEAVVRAQDALDQGQPFHAYLIDWKMPDLSGIETVRRIRRTVGNEPPIVIMTVYDWTDIETEARRAGATAFCAKPIFMSELREVLGRLSAEEEPAREIEGERATFAGRRVLLVEDNELNQKIAQAFLDKLEVESDVAEDGVEAVERMMLVDASYYDLILMDIQMPHMDGYEAARRIHALSDAHNASVPIVAVTANAFEEDKRLAYEAGMSGYLAKPYRLAELVNVLERAFAK